MSRAKGNAAAAWVAAYLRPWWPLAGKTPNGRPGEDIENTPGVSWEIKTGAAWRHEWLAQAERNSHGKLAVVVYLPPGCVHCIENTGPGVMRIMGVFHPAGSPMQRSYDAAGG